VVVLGDDRSWSVMQNWREEEDEEEDRVLEVLFLVCMSLERARGTK
jgi:hypothetical protein